VSAASGRVPAAAQVRRPRARTAERREEILRAAMTVFGDRGFRNGSLAEIAELAGMTHAGVLHHFGSKDGLLLALLEYRDESGVADLDGGTPQGAAFLEHLVSTVARNEGRPGIVQTYAVLSGEAVTDDHPGRGYFRGRYEGLRGMVERALADAAGVPADRDDVRDGAAAIIAAMDGLQVQWLLSDGKVGMTGPVQLVIESVLERIRSR
jgi:AcrR family transcriptional regulator